MKFDNKDSENLKNDYFEGPDLEDPVEKKTPKKKPEDPDYYDDEDDRWEHLRPPRNLRFWIYLLCGALVAGVLAFLYTWMLNPYGTGGVQYGYLDHVEKRGTLFKTYECVMIPYKEIMDTTRVYKEDFIFSVHNGSVGETLREMAVASQPVKVEYVVYHSAMPWRGERKIVVTRVDTVNAAKILPPEYTPEYFKSGNYRTDSLDNEARQRHIDEFEE